MIDAWLKTNGNPFVDKYVSAGSDIAELIRKSVEEHGLSNNIPTIYKVMMRNMEITEDQARSILLGTYNLTLSNIVHLESIFEISIIKKIEE